MVLSWVNESAQCTFDILIDGKKLVEENLVGKWNKKEMINVEYPIPAEMLKGKSKVTVSFQSRPGHTAGGVFGVRLLTVSDK